MTCQQSTQLGEQALYQPALPGFDSSQGYHNSPEYLAAIASVTSDPYYSQIESGEFLDVPYVTQCPLPTNLQFLDNPSLEEIQLSWGMQNPVQSQRLPKISDQPQPIVYRQIPQRGCDDLQGIIPPNSRKRLAPSIHVAPELKANSAHLSVMPQHKVTGSDGHRAYAASEPVSFVAAPAASGDTPYFSPSSVSTCHTSSLAPPQLLNPRRGIPNQWMHHPPYGYATSNHPLSSSGRLGCQHLNGSALLQKDSEVTPYANYY
ncbi:hypothetical protein EDC04DRAFT_1528934 [Pisolithus marmoratus]|nr:hypothetical protein EDC04DRAFT_1528934 [Pisolithus marmoratus]